MAEPTFLARFPDYGAPGCICGTHATPDPECDLHFAIAYCEQLEAERETMREALRLKAALEATEGKVT